MDLQRYQRAIEATELKRGIITHGTVSMSLSFESGLEQEYLRDSAHSVILLQRLTLLIAVLLYGSFLTHDALTIGRFSYDWLYGILLGVSAPANLLLLLSTFFKNPERFIFKFTEIAAFANFFSLIAVCILCFQQSIPFPYEVLLLQQLFNYYLLGLPVRSAAPLTLACVLFFVFGMIIAKMPYSELFEHAFILLAGAILGSMGCYMHERKRRQAWLNERLYREISENDPLTGIANRRAFEQAGENALKQAIRDKKSVAVVILDLDHFKKLNDQYGHLQGDDCLRLVAQAINQVARRPFDCAARYGGEEFCIFLYDISYSNAQTLGENLRANIAAIRAEIPENMTASFGIACLVPTEGVSLNSLMNAADRQMYLAKNNGRNRVEICDSLET